MIDNKIELMGLQLLEKIPYLVFFDNELKKYYYIKVEMIHNRLV